MPVSWRKGIRRQEKAFRSLAFLLLFWCIMCVTLLIIHHIILCVVREKTSQTLLDLLKERMKKSENLWWPFLSNIVKIDIPNWYFSRNQDCKSTSCRKLLDKACLSSLARHDANNFFKFPLNALSTWHSIFLILKLSTHKKHATKKK